MFLKPAGSIARVFAAIFHDLRSLLPANLPPPRVQDVDAMNYSAVTAFADVLGGLIGAGEVMHKRVIAMEDETALMKFMALAQVP